MDETQETRNSSKSQPAWQDDLLASDKSFKSLYSFSEHPHESRPRRGNSGDSSSAHLPYIPTDRWSAATHPISQPGTCDLVCYENTIPLA